MLGRVQIRWMLGLGLLWISGLLLPLSGQTQSAPPPAQADILQDDVTARAMVQRGDSLRSTGMWVAALSMYKGAQQRTFDPCIEAEAAVGIAEIHQASENSHEARWAAEAAQEFAAHCGHSSDLVLRLSSLWVKLNEDDRSRALIDAALEVHPHPALWTEKVMLAHLSGHPESTLDAIRSWESSGGPSDTHPRVAQVHAMRLQAEVMRDTVWLASEEDAFEKALEPLSPAQECALREQVYLVLKASGESLQALHWAETIRDRTPTTDHAGRTLAELRIAHCARDAHRPLDALIAYHEARTAAEATGDNALIAETLRQVAGFETERGHAKAALAAWAQVDSLNQLLLAQIQPRSAGRKREFSSFVTPAPDRFDQAAAEAMSRPQGVDMRSSGWPWLAAIGWIGVMAFALKNRSMRDVLHRERQRLATLRQLVNVPSVERPVTSLVPEFEGEPVRSIESLLREMDQELAEPVNFEVLGGRPILITRKSSDRLKSLIAELVKLQKHSEIFGTDPVSIQVIDRDRDWQIKLNGPRISTSPSLKALFQPKPGMAATSEAGAWLRDAMQELACKLTVERTEGTGESWIFTMPKLQV